MGRVSREQAERNRERVVETACRLFRQHGVENVSIADIMSEAGLTPGGFYKQFVSKEALVDEAFELAFKQSSGSWKEIGKRNEAGLFQGLPALIQHYFKRRPREHSCPILAFSSLVSYLPSDARTTAVYGSGVEKLFAQFKEAASKTPKQKGSEKLPEADVMVLFAAMVGAGLLTRAIGQTPWISQIQSAVLGALPAPEQGSVKSI